MDTLKGAVKKAAIGFAGLAMIPAGAYIGQTWKDFLFSPDPEKVAKREKAITYAGQLSGVAEDAFRNQNYDSGLETLTTLKEHCQEKNLFGSDCYSVRLNIDAENALDQGLRATDEARLDDAEVYLTAAKEICYALPSSACDRSEFLKKARSELKIIEDTHEKSYVKSFAQRTRWTY